jgi:hypothetical protein
MLTFFKGGRAFFALSYVAGQEILHLLHNLRA